MTLFPLLIAMSLPGGQTAVVDQIGAADFHRARVLGLAIEHFNAKHDSTLTEEDVGFGFMASLLAGLDTAWVNIGAVFPVESGPSRLFTGVWFEGRLGDPRSIYAARSDSAVIAFNAAVFGCRADSTLVPRDYIMRGEYRFVTYDLEPSDGYPCDNQVAARLRFVGFDRAEWLDFPLGRGRVLTLAFRTTGPWRDMDAVRKLLALAPSGQLIGSLFAPISFRSPWGWSDVVLIESNGSASLQDIVILRATYAWGDCPSGCINRHHLLFVARPWENTDGGFKFTITLAGEWGSGPLPDGVRRQR